MPAILIMVKLNSDQVAKVEAFDCDSKYIENVSFAKACHPPLSRQVFSFSFAATKTTTSQPVLFDINGPML